MSYGRHYTGSNWILLDHGINLFLGTVVGSYFGKHRANVNRKREKTGSYLRDNKHSFIGGFCGLILSGLGQYFVPVMLWKPMSYGAYVAVFAYQLCLETGMISSALPEEEDNDEDVVGDDKKTL